jgi:ubiquinone/menaquinone biosynthesis C-methylase UbiE
MIYAGAGLLDPFALLERAGLDSGCVVADLGCGALGHFVFPSADIVGADGRVYALDVERSAVKRVEEEARREQYWNIQSVWSDVEHPSATPIPSNAVDLTLIVNTLYLSPEPTRWAQEAFRITRPGGRALVIDWHPEAKPLGPATDLRLAAETVQELFARQGWIIEEMIVAGDHHYGLLCSKPDVALEPSVEFISHPTT